MGIADYGQASSGTVFYTASSFIGVAAIENLSVCAASSPCGSTWLSLQLNLNLGFEDGGNWYVYWIQDVALVDTGSQSLVAFEDNIWNLSGSATTMYSSTVSGYGSVQSEGYYADGIAIPSGFVTYPGTLQLILNTSVSSNGQPVVDFMFDYGRGFSTYDVVTFSFVSQLAYSDDFIVDGSTPDPAGLGYDAELVLGGPGNGASTIDENSNLQLTLQYWNGNNYESINDAENHGEDTAETVSNSDVVGYYYTSSGSLFAQVSAGTENINPLWFSSDIAIVNVQGPGSCNATLRSGSAGIPYLGGNGSIAVGATALDFQVSCDGFTQDLGTFDLSTGSTTTLEAGTWANLNFGESGLPSGTNWSISIGSDLKSGSGVLLSFYLPPGTYQYSVSGGAGYLPSLSAGGITVSSAGAGVTVAWQLVRVASNLPAGNLDVGQSVQFSVALTGTAGDTFSWSGLPNGCLSTNSTTLPCRPSSSGPYQVTVSVTDSSGFIATSAPFPFIVYTDPSVAAPAGSTPSSDVGQVVTFSSVSTPGSGSDTYYWTGLPRGCTSSDSNTVSCSPTDEGVYSINVTVTDSNDRVASATGAFTVSPMPTVGPVIVSPGSTILSGQSVTFTTNATPGSGGLTYAWTGLPPGCQAVDAASLTCTPSSAGIWNVSVTVMDSNRGAATSAEARLSVQPSFLGLPALEGYALVSILVLIVVIALIVGLAGRRRKRPDVADDRTIAERVRTYSRPAHPSPVQDITVPLSEVWSDQIPAGAQGAYSEDPTNPPDTFEPATPGAAYWATPLINPPDRVCWHCHFENPPGSRYCAQCALPLEPPPPPGSSFPTSGL